MGFKSNPWTLQIILPIGISFYTFHGLSYLLDIYKNKIKPELNFIDYSLFVSFFPLLVAGPIERASHLLPQIKKVKTFDYDKAMDGIKQILWGLFKKIVVADQCAIYCNLVFENTEDYSGSNLLLGAIFFTFQIYGDFSGYSDIALGTARLFGIELLKNFSYPYFSRDIAEFWRRWHISLSSWFRDYVYIPLGGGKGSTWLKIRNTFLIFLISGFWHGANWTFIVWGILNAFYIMPSIIMNTNRHRINIVAEGRSFPTLDELVSILSTFSMTVFAWIFFRAKTVQQAFNYIYRIFCVGQFSKITLSPKCIIPLSAIALMIILEWLGRENNFAIEKFEGKSAAIFKYPAYFLLVSSLFVFSSNEQEFIYFQF